MIATHLDVENTLISLMSAKALINIDAERAVPVIIPLITARDDWAAARVASLLREAGPEATSRRLAHAILNGTAEEAEKLIAYLPMVFRSVASDVVHEMLRRTVDDRVTAVCLRVVDSPLELPLIRQLTEHPRWHIRMRAAVALGRMGYWWDKQYLIRLLSDPEWWVRLRTVGSLARITHSVPEIWPMPVTRAAPTLNSVSVAARVDSSRKGASSSTRSSMRSRAS